MSDSIDIAPTGARAAVDVDGSSATIEESHSLPLVAPPVEELELMLKT
jgi:hypothetical protein